MRTTEDQILDDLARHLLSKIGRNIDDFIQLCRIAELSPGDVMPRLVSMLLRLTASMAVNEYIEADEHSVVVMLLKQMRKAKAELAEEED